MCFQKFDGAPGYARQFLRRRTRQTMFRAINCNELVHHAGFAQHGMSFDSEYGTSVSAVPWINILGGYFEVTLRIGL